MDIYGGCGSLVCERKNETACWEMVERDYYFYLSFENSICADYVTEKFFNAMTRNIVPIVFGGTDYHGSAGAPPHSHINAFKDFKDPKQLALYLHSLIEDHEKYAEYFWWKDSYESINGEHVRLYPSFCNLCLQLHEDKQTKIYTDLEDWWDTKSKCDQYVLLV